MLETPHVVLGAAIAIKVGNPYLAVPIAFLSHFVLDKIPHWNPHFYTETNLNGTPDKRSIKLAAVDSTLALVTGLFIASQFLPDYNKALIIIVCSFAGVLSDVIKIPYFFLNKRTGFFKIWTDFERSLQVDTSIVPGILTQLVVIITSFWWMTT